MRYRTITGLAGTLVVALVALLGFWGLVETVVADPSEWVLPSLVTLAVALGFVVVLFLLSAWSDGWFQRVYW